MRKIFQRPHIFAMGLVLGACFTAPLRGESPSNNRWVLRKKREGGSLWLADKKKQPVMEIQGGILNRVESVSAGSVMDPDLRTKLQRFSLNARRMVDTSKSLALSSQGHYGIVLERTEISPETPDYPKTAAERAAHPWPSESQPGPGIRGI